ncbi:P13 family porin [Borreliella burgdorferi]
MTASYTTRIIIPFKFANRYNENLKKTRHWACRF